MRQQRISVGFSKYSDPGMLAKAQLIASKMKDNAYLPTPVPSLSILGDAITTYSNALTNALKLGTDNVAEKNKARKALVAILVELGQWVTFAANGDITIMLSSGFDVTKAPETQYLGTPEMVLLGSGPYSGTISARLTRVTGAINYNFQLCTELPDENTVWTTVSVSRSRYIFTNLQPGKQYWVRVAAIGTRDQVTYSPVSTLFAQ